MSVSGEVVEGGIHPSAKAWGLSPVVLVRILDLKVRQAGEIVQIVQNSLICFYKRHQTCEIVSKGAGRASY